MSIFNMRHIYRSTLYHFSGFIVSFTVLAIISISIVCHPIYGQDLSIEETENSLRKSYGLEKLKALNLLCQHYQYIQERKALKYGRQAVALSENIFSESNTAVDMKEKSHQLQAYFQLGEILFEQENYLESRENLILTESLSIELNIDTYAKKVSNYLAAIKKMEDKGELKDNVFRRTLNDIKIGEVFNETSNDLNIQKEIQMARTFEKNKDFSSAITHYEKAINLLRNKGDALKIGELQLKIAVLLDSLDRHTEARDFLDAAIIEQEQGKSIDPSIKDSDEQDDGVNSDEDKARASTDSLRTEKENLKKMAENFAAENDYEKSLAYYKLYLELSQKMEADSLIVEEENARKMAEITMLRQQKQIADLNIEASEKERQKQMRMRNNLLLIALLIFGATLGILYFYLLKRKEHKKLTVAYDELDNTKNKLQDAEKRIVALLSQQVSSDIANELISNTSKKTAKKHFVCIMFLDIRDFTSMAETISPEQLIEYQNKVFGFMIDIVEQHHGNINQLLGDGFMATFGAPTSHGNDCQNAFLASREILKELDERIDSGFIKKTRIGIGLHAGLVVSGNVGNEARKQYSITGNPVIIASRIEQLNKKYNSQLIITEEVYNELGPLIDAGQEITEVNVKGRSQPVKIIKIA